LSEVLDNVLKLKIVWVELDRDIQRYALFPYGFVTFAVQEIVCTLLPGMRASLIIEVHSGEFVHIKILLIGRVLECI